MKNLRKPFDDFDARLREARGASKSASSNEERDRPSWGSGLQAGIEVVAGVGVGLLIGVGLDSWLDTTPLFIIVFFVLGAAAGVLNSWRWMRRWSAQQETSEDAHR